MPPPDSSNSDASVRRAVVTLEGGMAFEATTGSGHSVALDAAAAHGGGGGGASPMEMILVGLGGCTAFDVVHILEKGREPITACEVELEAERASTEPKVFTKIHLVYKLRGRGLKHEAVERAITLSAEKYCSASVMLGQVAAITHDWEVLDDATGSAAG